MKRFFIIIFVVFIQAYSFANESNNDYQKYSNESNSGSIIHQNTRAFFGNSGVYPEKPYLYTAGLMAVEFLALLMLNEHDNDPGVNNFLNAYKDWPRPDDDSAVYNLILHPLMGSETYLRARECNYGILGSIGFSLGASFTWEYLVESWTEHPSRQDLIYTTGIGWLFGELRYYLLNIMSRGTHWILDPINIFLEHVNIGLANNPKNKKDEPMVVTMSSWRF